MIGLHRRNDGPLRGARVHGAVGCRTASRCALYTKDSIDSSRRPSTWSSSSARAPTCAGSARASPGCARSTRSARPSFSVNAEHKLYHCFGCGASGDAIGFVQETEGLDFKQAVEALAERYNVELKREQEDPAAERRRERRERLLKLVQRATEYYARYLWESGEAKARARVPGRARARGAGAARVPRRILRPSAWDKVTVAAQRDGFTREEIAAAGLGQRGRGGSGLLRPLPRADHVPAGGPPRARAGLRRARRCVQSSGPKYLNTSRERAVPQGPPALRHRPGPGARPPRGVGSSWSRGTPTCSHFTRLGLNETVAIMGTAVTPEQVTLLSQTANTVFLALDADRSGQEAMLRASRIAADRGVELRVVEMPEGTDPADLVAERGRGRVHGAARRSASSVGRVSGSAGTGRFRSTEPPWHGTRRSNRSRPLIATADSPATRDHLVRYVADKLDLAPEVVTISLQSAPRQGRSALPETSEQQPRRAPRAPARRRVPRLSAPSSPCACRRATSGANTSRGSTDGQLSSEALRLTRDHLMSALLRIPLHNFLRMIP